MNVACPECSTVYRVDPSRIPDGEAQTHCRECGTALLISADANASEPGAVTAARRVVTMAPAPEAQAVAEEPASPPAASGPEAPVFGPQNPQTRARRLARALVSDIKVYNRERWEQSRGAGTLRRDFRDEILKSWEEYVEQVGTGMAKQTPYFRDALNDILADGERMF